MKKICLYLVMAFPIMAWSQSGNYKIKGNVGSLNAPAKAYLRHMVDGNVVTDSVVMKNGHFSFKGKTDEPAKAMLMINHKGSGRVADALTFFLEKGKIKVNSEDSIKHAVIKGSDINKDDQKLQNLLQPVNDKVARLNAEYATFSADQKKDESLMKDIRERAKALDEEKRNVLKYYIQTYPATFVSLDALNTYGGSKPDLDDIQPLFESLSSPLKNSKAGIAYAAKLEKVKLTSIGAMAPEFSQNDPNGVPVSLSSFKGKYVLIDFWASWCGPCRAENPNLVKAYQAYKDQNFTVLGVSLDQPNAREKWLQAIEKDELTWTQVSDLAYWKNAVAVQYGINAIPQNFLIDPNGKIIAKNIRGEELQTTLEKLIK